MSGPIIVTAAGSSFFTWVLSLVGSLQGLELFPWTKIAIVDVGLEPEQRRILRQSGAVITAPQLPTWWRQSVEEDPVAASMLCRPHYPEMFRNADPIVHVDADIWFADPQAIETIVNHAAGQDIDIVAAVHDHPSYRPSPEAIRWRARNMGLYSQTQQVSVEIPASQYVNSGLFAARANSPLWQIWKTTFARMAHWTKSEKACDQAALNVAIREARLRLYCLAPTYNWLSHLASPAFDPQIHRLTEPFPPFAPLQAIHVSGKDKTARHSISVIGGGAFDTQLDQSRFITARDSWLSLNRPAV